MAQVTLSPANALDFEDQDLEALSQAIRDEAEEDLTVEVQLASSETKRSHGGRSSIFSSTTPQATSSTRSLLVRLLGRSSV